MKIKKIGAACCGNCLFRKTIIYGPNYDTVKLSCKKGYKLNSLLQPVKENCWEEYNIVKAFFAYKEGVQG